MKPVVSLEEMREFDARAVEDVGFDELVRRAGYAVAHQATTMLEGASGKRIGILAGGGSNGEDGRVAARVLEARGALVTLLAPDAVASELGEMDLLIDAAFGTGLTRPYEAPAPPEPTPVLAVDLPSGLNGDTGAEVGRPLRAAATVTMGALKAGLLLGRGPELSGELHVADIGIDTSASSMALIEDADLALIPERSRADHKWSNAVVVMAGSPGMEGAAALSCLGAMHAGAGMVHLLSPGETSRIPLEIVIRPTEVAELAAAVLADSSRAGAVVLGPGLGRDPQVADAVRSVVSQRSTPVVLDADGLAAVGGVEELAFLVSAQPSPIVITPHDGELARLLGEPVSIDRVAQLASLVEATGVTVLSKGPTTLVLSPSREQPAVLFVTAGTQALATAGTGDVLAGVIGALLAFGLAAPLAASLGAHLHGVAGARSPGILVSSALPSLIGDVLAEVQRGS